MTRTITLTGRAPVRITEEQWPMVAIAEHAAWDNQYRFQANRTWDGWVRARCHADGRVLVYGCDAYASQFPDDAGYEIRAGYLLEAGADVCAAIERVAATIIAAGGGVGNSIFL